MNFNLVNAPYLAPLVFIWLFGLSFFIWRTLKRVSYFTKDEKMGDLGKLLEEYVRDLKLTGKEVEKLKERLEDLEEKVPSLISKVGLVRFNPYKEVGGNISFSVAFLDKSDSGLVISALHSRDQTRVYAKPVLNGKEAKYPLSTEEMEAIKKADKPAEIN